MRNDFCAFFFYNIRLGERMKILWNNVDRLILFCCWSTSSIECDVENKNIETIKEDEIFLYANLGKVIRKESYDFIFFVGISNRFDIFD